MLKKGSVTIKDIAHKLDVSYTTVSRALADNPLVKAETKKAIQDLAKEYHYTRNFRALSLRNNKTHTIGIIIPQLAHEFFSLVVRGIEDYAHANNYHVIISSSHESYEREVIDTKSFVNGRVDGLIACVTKESSDHGHFQELKDRGIPLVFFDSIFENISAPKVVLDDINAGYQAVRHLIEQGSRRIAYIGRPVNQRISKDRFAGYKKALAEAGIVPQEEWIIQCEENNFSSGGEQVIELLREREIDGIFAITDMLAIHAIKAVKKLNLSVPDDIPVIGFSNGSIGKLYEPSISTMSQPGYEMGKKAAELLFNQIVNPETEDSKTYVLESELLIRDSSQRALSYSGVK